MYLVKGRHFSHVLCDGVVKTTLLGGQLWAYESVHFCVVMSVPKLPHMHAKIRPLSKYMQHFCVEILFV